MATSSPVNWITWAIAAATFVIIATYPPPSLAYTGMKTEEMFLVLAILSSPFFVLYLIARSIIAIFGRRREAIFLACALWALLTPVVIGFAASSRYGNVRYGDVSARHLLVAKLYDSEPKNRNSPEVRAAQLIDLREACYPGYSGYQCWVVVASPVEDSDVALDIGDWHEMKSSTLLRLLPAYVQYGEVSVRRIQDRVYSVLSHDYQGR